METNEIDDTEKVMKEKIAQIIRENVLLILFFKVLT